MATKLEISRRRFLQQTAALTVPLVFSNRSLALSSALAGREEKGARQRPLNFLFIMADDLGWADLGCFGSRDIKTPVLDTLARQGIRFTHAYANSPVCSATRIAFNTMNYQQRLPIGNMEPVPVRKDMVEADLIDNMGIPAGYPTVANLLKAAGYGTALFGKWHMGYFNTPEEKAAKGGQGNGFGPLANGYDEFFGILGGGADHFTHTDWYGEADLWQGEEPAPTEGYLDDLFTERAVAYLRKQARSNTPFFLNLCFHTPHWPFEVPDPALGPNNGHTGRIIPDKWYGLAYPVTEDHPLGLGGFDQGSRGIYTDMVQRLDRNIGKVLAALEAAGLSHNTVVIFNSDNGGERFSDVWPFIGAKGHLYEGGIRVPAILRWPGLPANKVSEQVVASFDWSVTLLAAAGVPVTGFDGMDLRPILGSAGNGTQQLVPRALFWRFAGQRAAIIGQYKYLRLGDKPSGAPTDALLKFSDMPNYLLGDIDGPPPAFGGPGPGTVYEYIFDLAKDPREQANLMDNPAYADITAGLKTAWTHWESTVANSTPSVHAPAADVGLKTLTERYGD